MPNFLLNFSVSYQIGGYNLYTQARKNFKIILDRLNVSTGILFPKVLWNGLAVQDNAINDVAPCVRVESLHMLRGREIDCFARLPHQIHEVDFQGRGLLDGLRNAIYENVWDHARVKRSGTKSN